MQRSVIRELIIAITIPFELALKTLRRSRRDFTRNAFRVCLFGNPQHPHLLDILKIPKGCQQRVAVFIAGQAGALPLRIRSSFPLTFAGDEETASVGRFTARKDLRD